LLDERVNDFQKVGVVTPAAIAPTLKCMGKFVTEDPDCHRLAEEDGAAQALEMANASPRAKKAREPDAHPSYARSPAEVLSDDTDSDRVCR
jgi:hypothetical protein